MTTPLIIAYHEAGHAVVGMALGIGIPKLESRLCHTCADGLKALYRIQPGHSLWRPTLTH
jgi:hypothetical protein